MADYTLPKDLTVLSDDDIESNLTAAVRAFGALAKSNTVAVGDIDTLKELKASIDKLKAEKADRLTAAEEAAAEIDALSAEVFGEAEAETEAETEAGVAEAEAVEAAEVIEPTAVVTASGVRRQSLNLSAVRAKQGATNGGMSRYLPSDQPTGIEIMASVDVPGFRPGQEFDLEQVTEGVMRRASGLKTAGGGTGLVASYKLPFTEDLVVRDGSSAPEGSLAVMRAADQRRLPGGSLVASGGWCAPSQTVYDITDVACPDGLWTAPEIQLERGGLRFFRTPTLDVNALTWIHTEQDDIAGATKPCFKIPCPAPVDVRCEAIGVCLEAGILTQRFFPELIDWYVRNSMVAHEIRIATAMYDLARAASTLVTIPVSFGAFSAVFGAVALEVADMIERHHLCSSIELVFPFWAKNMFLADIARQQGVNACDLDDNCIEAAFRTLGDINVQWAKGLAPDVPTNIGGTTAATGWPADVEFLLYPSGNFQIGRGAEVSLGVIHDSTKFSTNDYTAMFTEECVALIDRGIDSRRVVVTVCPNGVVGAVPTTGAVCPIA